MTNATAPVITQEQIDAWREREGDRFNDGTYTPLPCAWRLEPWFMYGLADWDAVKKVQRGPNGEFRDAPESHPRRNHFAHVSMTDGAMIAFTENDIKGAADRQTKMKAGRYLKKFFGDVLNALKIRDLATAFEAEFQPLELQIATTPDDIEHVYTHGPSSCMSHVACDYSSRMHPVRAYGDSDLQLAYVARGEDNITARALIWPEHKVHSRIYGDAGRLKPLLRDAGYKEGDLDGARIRLIRDGDQYVCPYVDDIGYAEEDGTWLVLGSGSICVQQTTGYAGPQFRCDDCGDGMSEDDCYSSDYGEGSYCSSCFNDNFTRCERLDIYVHNDDTVEMANGDMWSTRAFDRYGDTCAKTEERYPADEMVEMADGEMWCQAAFDEHGATCAATGGRYAVADTVTLADGTVWSQDHFDLLYGATADNGELVRADDAPNDAVRYRRPDTLELPLPDPAKPDDTFLVECVSVETMDFTRGKHYRARFAPTGSLDILGDDVGDARRRPLWQFRVVSPAPELEAA